MTRPTAPWIAGSVAAVVLVAGALTPDWRPAAALVLVAGWAGLRAAGRHLAIGWAAALPVGIALTWPVWLGADAPLGALGCADPLSIIALRRVVLAILVISLAGGLAGFQRLSLVELGLRRPRGPEVAIAIAGLLTITPGGLVIGPLLAEPFFGRLAFERPIQAVVPAIGFAVANGTLEELAYRGALQAWLGRVCGPTVAILFQGVVFGIVHVGPEVTDLVPVHVALMSVAGTLAGLIVARTGSLAIPIAVHVGADIALYYGLACRSVPA